MTRTRIKAVDIAIYSSKVLILRVLIMAKGRGNANSQGKRQLRRLKLTNDILLGAVVVLVLYILYPHILSITRPPQLGNTTYGIDSKFSSSQLATINNAPNSYFQSAAEMMLNGSISGEQVGNDVYAGTDFQIALKNPQQEPAYISNGKPSVIYIGAISCIWCGENRWAMALALSRFGNFSSLYTGYSSIHDGDVPTIYWKSNNYTSNGTTYGNYYSSSYINFFSADYDSDINAGFELPAVANPISYFVQNAPNQTYQQAMEFMNSTNAFQGTPFTFWGTSINKGADGVVFGTPQNSSQNANYPPLTFMTHKQILEQFASFNTTFAYEEYAAADVYVAEICSSLNNAPDVCSLSGIKSFESKMGLA